VSAWEIVAVAAVVALLFGAPKIPAVLRWMAG
jgi:Sec-independent protein translocase protein TatA